MENVTNNVIKFPHFGPETKEGPKEWDDLDGLKMGYDRVVSKVYLDGEKEVQDELTFIYDILQPFHWKYSLNPSWSGVVKDLVIHKLWLELSRSFFNQNRPDPKVVLPDLKTIIGIRLQPLFTFNNEEQGILVGGVEWSSHLDPIFINFRKKYEEWNLWDGMVFDEHWKYLESREKRNYEKWRQEVDSGSYSPKTEWITNTRKYGLMEDMGFRLQGNPPTKL